MGELLSDEPKSLRKSILKAVGQQQARLGIHSGPGPNYQLQYKLEMLASISMGLALVLIFQRSSTQSIQEAAL